MKENLELKIYKSLIVGTMCVWFVSVGILIGTGNEKSLGLMLGIVPAYLIVYIISKLTEVKKE